TTTRAEVHPACAPCHPRHRRRAVDDARETAARRPTTGAATRRERPRAWAGDDHPSTPNTCTKSHVVSDMALQASDLWRAGGSADAAQRIVGLLDLGRLVFLLLLGRVGGRGRVAAAAAAAADAALGLLDLRAVGDVDVAALRGPRALGVGRDLAALDHLHLGRRGRRRLLHRRGAAEHEVSTDGAAEHEHERDDEAGLAAGAAAVTVTVV